MALVGISAAGTTAKSKNSSVLFNLKISSIGTERKQTLPHPDFCSGSGHPGWFPVPF